uniref:Transcription factor A, mitochondrial n=1 Tax=Lygus hesperus TaxID=30085 RepID=A0A0A9Y2J2_LYGHE
MLTLAILALAAVSTSALPTPELQRNAYDDFDEFQRFTPESSGVAENEALPGLADLLSEWSHRPDIDPRSGRLIDRLGDDRLLFEDGDIDVWKRRVDSLGGNNLVRRSLDRLGGYSLVKTAARLSGWQQSGEAHA